MLARATLVVAALAASARADEPLGAQATFETDDTGIATEVSLGGGGDTTAGSYSVARLQLTTGLARPAPPAEEAGFHMCPVEEPGGCIWFFTAPDPGGLEGVGARGEAELLMPTSRATANGSVWARWGGFGIEATGSVQPVPGLRAPMWRSGRGVFEGRTTLDIPFFALGTKETQVVAMPWRLALGRRVAFDGESAINGGFDRDIRVSFIRVLHKWMALDVFHIGLQDFGRETVTRTNAMGTTVTFGYSASILDIEVANLKLTLPHGLRVQGQAGLRMLMPIGSFTRTGTHEQSSGPAAATPMFWGEVGHEDDLGSIVVGGGNWSRLDPTAQAGDAGRLVQANVTRYLGRISVRSELALGRLERVVVGDRAPENFTLGTRYWMGRALLAVSVALRKDLAIEATTWAERSDRDDPRWGTPATGEVVPRFGADVSAAWRFTRKR